MPAHRLSLLVQSGAQARLMDMPLLPQPLKRADLRSHVFSPLKHEKFQSVEVQTGTTAASLSSRNSAKQNIWDPESRTARAAPDPGSRLSGYARGRDD
jgi:hypothetical protein